MTFVSDKSDADTFDTFDMLDVERHRSTLDMLDTVCAAALAHFPKSLCINAVHIIFQLTHIIFPVCTESHHFFEFRCFTSFFKFDCFTSFSWFRFMSSSLLKFLQKIADSNVVNFD
jgi:hypothetical protein